MHYKIGVTCVYNEQDFSVLYSIVITRQSNTPISQSIQSLCNEFTSVWSMFLYNTCAQIWYDK